MTVYRFPERFVTCSADRCNRAALPNSLCVDCCTELGIVPAKTTKPRRAA